MKRSEINQYIQEAIRFFESNCFYLPLWAGWTPADWQSKGKECEEIRLNNLGWDITDFGKGHFLQEGLTLVTIRNGNLKYDHKPYCEKIMMVREKQITPIHFHWKKMEDIINRGGGTLCIQLWKASKEEKRTTENCIVKIDGIKTEIKSGGMVYLEKGQSICFEPYMYHTFWAENGNCMVGEVSTVNDDANDNRFFEPIGRFPEIEEDAPAKYLLCTEYPQ
ncbi:D-lyxose/D-mannose family sugar isomerase [uncultured Odoribacter sp.]|uniref:D-lyxose/D-mannose family sugar isomerase n=1 Tax=uncultured Odoribacter sp. TaxID=876416 RepID=UPI002614FA17|nr:D-lyxose/D-mannose family sugar isomerase [uncultured Odoribacter sp.]